MTRRKTPHPPGNPEDWLHYAKGDLNLALVAKGRRGILPEQVCFHAQQACEKALKAVLVLNDIEFPLVHDIEALLDIARQGGVALPPEAESAGMLTPYAVEARFPAMMRRSPPLTWKRRSGWLSRWSFGPRWR